MRRLTEDERTRLERVVRQPFYVYSPSNGGGRDYASLINAGLISIEDVGDDQETVLLVSATKAGRRLALREQDDA